MTKQYLYLLPPPWRFELSRIFRGIRRHIWQQRYNLDVVDLPAFRAINLALTRMWPFLEVGIVCVGVIDRNIEWRMFHAHSEFQLRGLFQRQVGLRFGKCKNTPNAYKHYRRSNKRGNEG